MPRLPVLACLALGAGVALAASASSTELRLERVFLSSSGVVLLDHAAEVGASAELALIVPRGQVDDLLKSLTVYDAAGLAGTVIVAGEGPTADLLRDLPLGERDLASPQALLAALRGVSVRVGGAKAMAGRILSLVPEEQRVGEARLVRHRLTLATDEGLRSLLLEEADSIEIADPALNDALRTALTRLAAARRPAERQVTIRLEGPGPRRVRVAWLAEAPVWKMSYRALLGPGSARLQGWAVVDNRSGRDWDAVELTLLAGAPVTLRQALSRLIWAERPEVPIVLPEGIRPRRDEGALPAAPAAAGPAAPGRSRAMAAPPTLAAEAAPQAEAMTADAPAAMAAAEAIETATQTVFRLPGPMSLADGGTALVPVLDRALPAERLVLLQADRPPLRALAAVRIVNDGQSALPPGILSIFESGADGRSAFLGDAELALLPPGESRLVPYALDPAVRVEALPESAGQVVAVRAQDGLLFVERVERRVVRYRLALRPGEARMLLLDHPREPGFRLVEPAAAAETERFWRIERRLEPGAVAELVVVAERPERRELSLGELDLEELRLLFAGATLPEAVERAMAEIAARRAAIAELYATIERLEAERRGQLADQERLRSNLQAVPGGSDLARRYLAGLAASEDRLEALAGELARARAAAAAAEAELRAFVRGLRL